MHCENPFQFCKKFSRLSDSHNDDRSLRSRIPCHNNAVEAKALLTSNGVHSTTADGNGKNSIIGLTELISKGKSKLMSVVSVLDILKSSEENNALLLCSLSISPGPDITVNGPLVHDGTPYSAFWQIELFALPHRHVKGKVELMEIPTERSGSDYWQYGTACIRASIDAFSDLSYCKSPHILDHSFQFVMGLLNDRHNGSLDEIWHANVTFHTSLSLLWSFTHLHVNQAVQLITNVTRLFHCLDFHHLS